MRISSSLAQQMDELLYRKTSFPEDGAKCSCGNFLLVGNCKSPMRIYMLSQNDMRASLVIHRIHGFMFAKLKCIRDV
jgi:hypothetical protein